MATDNDRDMARDAAKEAEALNRAWRMWNRLVGGKKERSPHVRQRERLSRPANIQQSLQSRAEAKRIRRCLRNLERAGMGQTPAWGDLRRAELSINLGGRTHLTKYVKAAIKPSDDR